MYSHIITASFIAIFILFGCANKKNKFIGNWKINALEMNDIDDLENDTGKWEFDSDGFFIGVVGDKRVRGKWSIFGKDSIVLSTHKGDKVVGKYVFVDGKLKISGSPNNAYVELIREDAK